MTDTPPPPSSPPAPGTTRVIGLVGGIASGKSLAARVLAGPGGLCLSADELAHRILAEPEVLEQVVALFGPQARRENGEPDRAAIAARAFREPELRLALEQLIHPQVRERIKRALTAAIGAGTPLVALDVPLLLENDAEHGLKGTAGALVFVDSPLAEREARACLSRGWAPGEVARRESHQWPLEVKRRAADVIVLNDADAPSFERKLLRLRSLWERPLPASVP